MRDKPEKLATINGANFGYSRYFKRGGVMPRSRREIYEGLVALNEEMFPKVCGRCGQVFHSVDDYLHKTRRLFSSSGLRRYDEPNLSFVGLYRNCRCGSTLLGMFQDRRDESELGVRRRSRFQSVLDQLVEAGWDRAIAREEVEKILAGQKSALLELFLAR
jgi:hypothetical protein